MKRRIRWYNVIAFINATASAMLLISIPALNRAANATRMKPGYGGECIAWMMPLMIAIFFIAMEKDRKQF